MDISRDYNTTQSKAWNPAYSSGEDSQPANSLPLSAAQASATDYATLPANGLETVIVGLEKISIATFQGIVTAATQGSFEAFSELYNWYADQLFRYSYYCLNKQPEAEKLVGQTFVKIWDLISHKKLSSHAPFGTTLYNIAYELQRKGVAKSERELTKLNLMQPNQKLEAAILRQAILELNQEQQAIIYLRYIENWSHLQIAFWLGKSPASVQVGQFRAQRILGQLLDAGNSLENQV